MDEGNGASVKNKSPVVLPTDQDTVEYEYGMRRYCLKSVQIRYMDGKEDVIEAGGWIEGITVGGVTMNLYVKATPMGPIVHMASLPLQNIRAWRVDEYDASPEKP